MIPLPDDTQRISILGATGSGKTQAALWHLSNRDLNKMPWLIYNFKSDKSIDAIPGKIDIGVEEIPSKPGVFVVHPHPNEIDEVEAQMWAIWQRQNIGVYVDEGYMVGRNNPAFRAILTQGRSRGNPVIVLSQRPAWMDRFIFSESEFFQVFRLSHIDDQKSAEKFVPVDLSLRLPKYYSHYYDVGENEVYKLKPVPSIEQIHKTFDAKLKQTRRRI